MTKTCQDVCVSAPGYTVVCLLFFFYSLVSELPVHKRFLSFGHEAVWALAPIWLESGYCRLHFIISGVSNQGFILFWFDYRFKGSRHFSKSFSSCSFCCKHISLSYSSKLCWISSRLNYICFVQDLPAVSSIYMLFISPSYYLPHNIPVLEIPICF